MSDGKSIQEKKTAARKEKDMDLIDLILSENPVLKAKVLNYIEKKLNIKKNKGTKEEDGTNKKAK